MKEIILIKNGEIALKGLNRHHFEDALIRNIRYRLRDLGRFSITKSQSTIVVEPHNADVSLDEVCDRIQKIFGVAAFSRCLVTEKDMDVIKGVVADYVKDSLPYARSFKVAAKRSDKRFPFNSPMIQQEIGEVLTTAYPQVKVDVHNPEVTVTVEIRDTHAYIHASVHEGAGGMPVGTSGDALLLISGGIDSPVAGYMMARRGMKISTVHFVSPPYTSDRALQKVITLCERMSIYTGDIEFHCVPFTEIQEAIRDHCPEELFTVIMRRLMMKIAVDIAEHKDIPALVTGESLGQVASQTVYALATTDKASDRPVLRPLIGMDKNDIIAIARKIDTFETSILPYEDCCTVFVPKRPKTRPTLAYVEESEALFDFAPLLDTAIANTQTQIIKMET